MKKFGPDKVSESGFPKSPSPSVYENSKIIMESLETSVELITCADFSCKTGMGEFENGSFLHALYMKRRESSAIFAADLVMNLSLSDILNANLGDNRNFNETAVVLFRWQYENNLIYRQYVDLIGVRPASINHYLQIPFLPVDFFKKYQIQSGVFEPESAFSSSGTTGGTQSLHFVKSLDDYTRTSIYCFQTFFGQYSNYCHLALLPSYLERTGSSLIYMLEQFVRHSQYVQSGFYLNEFDRLDAVLKANEKAKVPTVLWGVTFALLDFAEFFTGKLNNTMIMETGGMKGRRKEITRPELYETLSKRFSTTNIASEYGMTEMFSQCYSKEQGVFSCPPHVKVLGRELNDPFAICEVGRNKAVNIIDLANIHSCAFIALSDLCNIHNDGTFEILGRVDMSEIRGCNLMVK